MQWTHEYMYSITTKEQLEENRFKTISDFKWCMKSGGEVGFAYNNKLFGIAHSDEQIIVYKSDDVNSITYYNTADEALECVIDGARLRDIITEIEVFDRTI